MRSQHTFAKLKIESDLLNDKNGKNPCFKTRYKGYKHTWKNNKKIELRKI